MWPRLIALLACAWPAVARAQEAVGTAWRCDGATVSTIVIERQPPTIIGHSAPGWARPVLRAALQHRTTQPSAIRPFLVLEEGRACTEFRRAESERLLRAQPYLADAAVTAVPDGNGGARIEVSTVDEVPLVIGGRASGGRISGVKYGSSNLGGEGLYAAAEWREGFAYRDGLGFRFVNYHAFGQPNRFTLVLERSPLDAHVGAAIERPLLTVHQRLAWHASASDGSEYTRFVRRAGPALALAVNQSRLDLGGTFRIGGERRRLFAGPVISHQRVDPAGEGVEISDSGLVANADPELAGRYVPVRRTRVAGSVGFRLLSFTRVRGFDALAGTQDVARGVQAAAVIGRSVAGTTNGAVIGGEVYLGAGGQSRFLALRAQWEGERAGEGGWRDAITSGRVVWYEVLSDRRTLVASGDFAGARDARVPYQLRLGRQAGVRGYHDSRAAGARRAVARAEHRWTLGPFTRFALLGASAFADVGAVWAGDVPYGRNSGVRTGIGAGLLASVPQRSRRTIRLDLAFPVTSDPDASYELRVTTSAPLREFWRDPASIRGIRTIAPPSGALGLP